ncbi:putative immunity protein [Spirosoma pomorum]
MILPKERDPRFITIRRGGTLTASDHHLLALWAAACAEHVLHLFEQANPDDKRPRQAIELTQAWVQGKIPMKQAHQAAFAANAAAKGMPDAAKFAALAAGQAVAVAHVAAHELGAAAYAIRAVRASVSEDEKDLVADNECQWQRAQLPDPIRELVLDDQKLRNHLCWFAFTDVT